MSALARRCFPLPTTQSSTSPCTGEDGIWGVVGKGEKLRLSPVAGGGLFVVIGDFFDIKKLSRGGEFLVRAKSN